MKPVFIIMALLLIPAAALADPVGNADALKGLTSVKIVCDVNVGEAQRLLRRLQLIDETYTDLLDAGVKPAIVVTFRGPATKYVTRGTGYVASGEQAVKKKIQGWIEQFRENGFSMEQCAIAAHSQKVATTDILPQIKVVGNGYVSLVAYQNKGYALLPMD